MTVRRVRVRRDTYVDSVGLLNLSRDMRGVTDVVWADALMGTAANVLVLAEAGFDVREVEPLRANDLVLAVAAETEDAAARAFMVAAEPTAGGGPVAETGTLEAEQPQSLQEAVDALGDANVAVISVPGAYAVLESHKALTAGLHVLLFSDNVTLADEVALKRRAAQLGLLIMGPGAGTAVLGGVGLGFANVVRHGPVRVVSAAGTGAQEVMTLLHRFGAGVSDVIGVGGRDLSREVGGLMARQAIAANRPDDGRDPVIVVVSKPPDPDVATTLLDALTGRRAVCAFIGLDRPVRPPQGVRVVFTLEQAVLEALDLLAVAAPNPTSGLRAVAERAAADLHDGRRAVRGLFSGGTLCYEAMVILARRLGAVHSNTPLREEWSLSAAPEGAHICLDLGEEEYTRGRPHPMIDPLARADELGRAAADPTVAVMLVDVVLGHGAHPDPAGELAKLLGRIRPRTDGPAVVAYVLGTDEDPQSAPDQRARLEEVGCVVAPTNARAALLAAAVAARRPELAEEAP
ncbi:MAG TPA: hypothetical protein VFR23_01470 [Jiangellaceae bacterium]|nr:hypothetical protein [Jiangellaceae bacterium]